MQIKKSFLLTSTLLIFNSFLALPAQASENNFSNNYYPTEITNSFLLDKGALMEGSESYTYLSNNLSRGVSGVYLTAWFQMKAPGLTSRRHVSYINGSKYQGSLYATGKKKSAVMNGNGELFYTYEFTGLLAKK